MKKPKIIIVLLISILTGLFLFITTGPLFRPITTQELIGNFKVQLPDGSQETLQLFPNKICKQDIYLKDGKSYSATGTWELGKFNLSECVTLRGVYRSILENTTKLNPEIDKTNNDTVICLPIHHTLIGHVEIGLYGGQGIIFYRKVR